MTEPDETDDADIGPEEEAEEDGTKAAEQEKAKHDKGTSSQTTSARPIRRVVNPALDVSSSALASSPLLLVVLLLLLLPPLEFPARWRFRAPATPPRRYAVKLGQQAILITFPSSLSPLSASHFRPPTRNPPNLRTCLAIPRAFNACVSLGSSTVRFAGAGVKR